MYGDIKITLLKTETLAEYTVRTFALERVWNDFSSSRDRTGNDGEKKGCISRMSTTTSKPRLQHALISHTATWFALPFDMMQYIMHELMYSQQANITK